MILSACGQPDGDAGCVSYVPGSRYVDKPVYLLTSRETFSGGPQATISPASGDSCRSASARSAPFPPVRGSRIT